MPTGDTQLLAAVDIYQIYDIGTAITIITTKISVVLFSFMTYTVIYHTMNPKIPAIVSLTQNLKEIIGGMAYQGSFLNGCKPCLGLINLLLQTKIEINTI